MKRPIVTVVLGAILGSWLLFALPGAQAASPKGAEDLKVSVIKASCDRRAPRVKVKLTRVASSISFRYTGTSKDIVLKSGTIKPGTHRFPLWRQPFGSKWTGEVIVAYKGDQGATTSKLLVLPRPKAEDCVRTQLHELRSFGKYVNKACPPGTVKDIVVRVWVKPGSPGYITWPGEATLTQKNGRFTSGPGQTFQNDRVAEYHATIGRKARLAFDKAQDVDVSVSSANVELRSGKGKRICMGAGT